jgi:flagellar biosynthesis/type III secretory pathway protein FliH
LSKKVIKAQYLIKAEPQTVETSGFGYFDGAFHEKEDTMLPDIEELYLQERQSIEENMAVLQEQLISEAKAKAEEIILEARWEADAIRQLAREEGLASGREEALKQAAEALGPLLEALKMGAKQLNNTREELVATAEGDLVDLALGIVRKLLGEGALVAEDTVVATLEKALSCAKERRRVVIRVNPRDLDGAIGEEERLKALFNDIDEITFVEDEGISRGGALVETGAGLVDARLETQMESIEAHLAGGDEL